ncbi:unnamed protein product [Rotaria sp. Silwood2]|nr:unnamed protein product [Rotaria sp. Silwood2]
MPRKLVPVSTIDPETGHISMRRSDPMINNINEYIIAACRFNMDIKFIWTGSDAKALVYYITDYVIKIILSFHDTLSLVQKYATDEDVYDETTNDENNDEENFQIQSTGSDKNYVFVNTRIDYQYRSDIFNDMCLYDFASTIDKKKMNAADLKYLSTNMASSREEEGNQRGRPVNERFPFQSQHPQAKAYVLMKYSEPHVPILYGPQIPRQYRDDTRERYCRAPLTLFVPWRTVTDLCDLNQTWEDAFKSRQEYISIHSWKIIENIQLLHECRKDRDEHLLQVITEAQTDNDGIDTVLLPSDQNVDGEYDIDDNEGLSELLNNIDEYTIKAINAGKRTTEDKYIQETIEAVEKVGRFSDINIRHQSSSNEFIDSTNQQLTPFVSATQNLVLLNKKWQEQLKTDRERVRQTFITGNYSAADDSLDLHVANDAIVTVMNPNSNNNNNLESYGSILPVVSVTTNFPTQKSIADEFTLNREQRAAFMIITSHLDGDSRCRTGIFTI